MVRWGMKVFKTAIILSNVQVHVKQTSSSKYHFKQDLVFSLPYAEISSTNVVSTSLLRKLRMRKEESKRAVPLDVVPERRTKRCSPRFRPGGRFWNQVSDTCCQAGRERNVGP